MHSIAYLFISFWYAKVKFRHAPKTRAHDLPNHQVLCGTRGISIVQLETWRSNTETTPRATTVRSPLAASQTTTAVGLGIVAKVEEYLIASTHHN